MALFKSDPTKTAARSLDSARTNLARLKSKLADTNEAIATHRSQAISAAASGAEDSVLDLVESTIRSLQDRAATLQNAISTVETQLAGLETAHAEAADRVQREATAAEIELLTRRCVESGAALLKAAQAHAEFIARIAPIVPEAGQVLHFALVLSNELPAATELIARLARQHREQVLAGSAPATLAAPPEAYVAPPIPAPSPTVTLFATQTVKWTDEAGRLRVRPTYTDVELPLKAAKRARELRAVVEVTDPVRQQYLRHVGGDDPDPDGAVDLDSVPERTSQPIQHSAFETPTIGPATILKIPRAG